MLSHFASPPSPNMTVESTTVPHVNSVVPNGDASNGNVIPSSKKSRESDRRRRRRKQKKNNKASRADAEEADVSGASDSKENADPQPQVGFVLTFSHSIHGIGDFLGFVIFLADLCLYLSRLRLSMFQSSLNSRMVLAMSLSKSLRSSVSRNLLPLR